MPTKPARASIADGRTSASGPSELHMQSETSRHLRAGKLAQPQKAPRWWRVDRASKIFLGTTESKSVPLGARTAPEEGVAMGGPIADRLWVGMSNGNVEEFAGPAGTWIFIENVFGATVQVEQLHQQAEAEVWPF